MAELTPGGMFPYPELPNNLIKEDLREFYRQVETAILAASGGSGFGLADPGADGYVVRTSVGATEARTFHQPSAGLTISNSDGVAGDSVFALANDLAGLEALSGTGFSKRTGTDTWILTNPTATDVGLGNVTNDAQVKRSEMGVANGVATLDSGGLIPNAQLPPLAITDTFVVASQAAMLALSAQVGDVAVRSDLNKSFILRLAGPGTLSNWQELLTPTDSVLSVFGRTGAVASTTGDYSFPQISGTLAVAQGGTGTATAFTPGSIVFAGANGVYTQANTNFFWDATNHRIGLGTASPVGVIDFAALPTAAEADVFRFRTNETGSGNFALKYIASAGSNGETRRDNQMSFGYNLRGVGYVSTEHTFGLSLESRYKTSELILQTEFYFVAEVPGFGSIRPFSIDLNHATGVAKVAVTNLRVDDGNGLNYALFTATSAQAELFFEGNSRLYFNVANSGGFIIGQGIPLITLPNLPFRSKLEIFSNATEAEIGLFSGAGGNSTVLSFNGTSGVLQSNGPGFRYNPAGPTMQYSNANSYGWWEFGDLAHSIGILDPSHGGTGIAYFSVAGPTALHVYTFPNADATIARIDVGQTFIGTNNFEHILPSATDTYDLGSSLKLWRKGWLSELDTILFSQNTQTLVGGWLVLSKNEGTIPAGQDVGAGDISIDFGQSMTLNDFVVFRSSLQVEYVQVVSGVSGTRYNVTRNLDGSGTNAWPAGSVYRVDGNSTNGRIELNANATPRISIIKQGATYNAQTEFIRLGDLNGWSVDYSSEIYGAAFGIPSGAWLKIDSTNGVRIGFNTSTLTQIDAAGNASFAGTITAAAGAIGGFGIGADYIRDAANSFGLASTVTGGDDVRFWAGNTFANRATAPFRLTEAGSLTVALGAVAGWIIATTRISSSHVFIDNTGEYISMGASPPTAYGNNVGVFLEGANSGRFSLYKDANNYFQWDNSKLIWKGANTSLDASGNLTVNAGTVGGWTINSTVIQNSAGTFILRSAGNLALGAIPPTSASVGTGLFGDSSGITGLLSNVVQTKIDGSTGAIIAGAGNVLLNIDGLTLTSGSATPNKIVWKDSGVQSGLVSSFYSAGVTTTALYSLSKSGDGTGQSLTLLSAQNDSGYSTALGLVSLGSSAGNAGYSYLNNSHAFSGFVIGATSTPNAMLDVRGDAAITGLLKTGSTPTTLTDSAGKILPGALSFGIPPTWIKPRFWMRADYLSLNDADAVGTLTDFSGNGFTLTQATSGKKPLFKTNILNGYPVIRGDGSDDVIGTASAVFTSDCTVFAVVINRSSTAGDYFSENQGGGDIRFHFYGGTTITRWNAGPGASLSVGEAAVISVRFSGTGEQMWKNGTSVGSDSSAPAFDNGELWLFGAGSTPNFPKQCDIAELIVVDSALSTQDRQSWERYLRNKYAL